MAQVKIVFYLPRKDNDGRSLRNEILAVEFELYVRFGGYTMRGAVRGEYRMPDGKQSKDISNAYELVTDVSMIADVESILLEFKSKTSQDSIYFEVQHQTDVRFLK